MGVDHNNGTSFIFGKLPPSPLSIFQSVYISYIFSEFFFSDVVLFFVPHFISRPIELLLSTTATPYPLLASRKLLQKPTRILPATTAVTEAAKQQHWRRVAVVRKGPGMMTATNSPLTEGFP
jgi:hypothetical protein